MILKLVEGVELTGSVGFIIMLIFGLVVNWHTDREQTIQTEKRLYKETFPVFVVLMNLCKAAVETGVENRLRDTVGAGEGGMGEEH